MISKERRLGRDRRYKARIKNSKGKRKKSLKNQTTFVYCPKCDNEMCGDESLDGQKENHPWVYFICAMCKHESVWDFDMPVPLLVERDA